MISQVLLTSEQPKENKMALVGILSQINLLFGSLVIQLVWYILKQSFTSVSVKVVDIYLAAKRRGKYPPLFTSTSVNKYLLLTEFEGRTVSYRLSFFLLDLWPKREARGP